MDLFTKIAVGIFAAFILFMLWRFVRSNPDSLKWENINKSMYSMGMLALGLIVFLGLVVWLLKQS